MCKLACRAYVADHSKAQDNNDEQRSRWNAELQAMLSYSPTVDHLLQLRMPGRDNTGLFELCDLQCGNIHASVTLNAFTAYA